MPASAPGTPEDALVFRPQTVTPAPASLPFGGPLRSPPPESMANHDDEATRPAQLSPGLSGGLPTDMDPLAFLQQAPLLRRPSEPTLPPVVTPPPATAEQPPVWGPPPAAAAPPPAEPDPFASPLASPSRPILPPVGFAAPGPLSPPPGFELPEQRTYSEGTISAMAPLQAKRLRMTIIIAAAATLVALLIGYLVGQISKDRQVVNKRIEDTKAVLAEVEKVSGRLQEIFPVVNGLSPDKPDFAAAEKLKGFVARLPMEDIEKKAGDNLLLGPRTAKDLIEFAALAEEFARKASEHGLLTTVKHKTYLEQILEANAAMQSDQDLCVFFTPNAKPGGPPPKGHLVMLAGQPDTTGKDIKVPVRTLSNPEVRPVDINLLVGLDRTELMQSAGPNVLQLHADRVKELKQLASDLEKKMTPFLSSLKKEAGKAKVASL